jgi:hypothetical protein
MCHLHLGGIIRKVVSPLRSINPNHVRRFYSATAGTRSPSTKKSPKFRCYYKNTLVALCHALEDCILTSQSQPLVITASNVVNGISKKQTDIIY